MAAHEDDEEVVPEDVVNRVLEALQGEVDDVLLNPPVLLFFQFFLISLSALFP